mmetsp:Transcript_10034/g.30445  ORF Transcript_10034/g.30445 Transcript_10034/m.30445 type:complete len:241 (+) Transcript_10034:1924-2646(+)
MRYASSFCAIAAATTFLALSAATLNCAIASTAGPAGPPMAFADTAVDATAFAFSPCCTASTTYGTAKIALIDASFAASVKSAVHLLNLRCRIEPCRRTHQRCKRRTNGYSMAFLMDCNSYRTSACKNNLDTPSRYAVFALTRSATCGCCIMSAVNSLSSVIVRPFLKGVKARNSRTNSRYCTRVGKPARRTSNAAMTPEQINCRSTDGLSILPTILSWFVLMHRTNRVEDSRSTVTSACN